MSSGAYSADIEGTNLLGAGTVSELHGFKNGVTIFDVTGLNVSIDTLNNDRDEPGELANDLFGGDDVFKGSKYDDVARRRSAVTTTSPPAAGATP